MSNDCNEINQTVNNASLADQSFEDGNSSDDLVVDEDNKQNDNDEEEEETDEEDEETEDDSDCDADAQESEMATELKPPLSPNSTPTCYICLNEFEGQDVGSPDSCQSIHFFCLECIEEWSKQVNTCPVDRKSFSFIFVRRDIDGEIVMKVPITKNSVIEIETIGDDVTYCEICGRCDREDRLLLCDGCDFGYHCECLTPPLDTIPVDEWFCPDCFERLFGEEVFPETFRRQTNTTRRAIARTGAFEIVRNRILARRTNQQNTNTTTRKTRKRKYRKSKRKTRKTTKSKSNKKSKRKSKKRTRKSKMSTWRLPSATSRSRIASKLGLGCKPKSPFGLPTMKTKSDDRSINEIRFSAGISRLSMFGYELDFSNPRSYDELEYESDLGEVGLMSATRHHAFPSISKSIKPSSALNSIDVLSEIMSSQEVLHASKSDLSVDRRGRVFLNLESNGGSIRKCPDYNSQSSSSSSNISNNDDSNNNNNYLNSKNSENSSEKVSENDISLVKPSPIVSLQDDKPDIELYSDIESVGDNKDCDENNSDKKTDKKYDNVESSQENETNTTEEFSTKTDINSDDSITCEKPFKRRPSIKDLFGGDSEEEVDDDLKQLVAQKGSINVHYPIKMPIVLKTNILSQTKKFNNDDEVPISKKWIPIYPEIEKTKSSGPKWKAIGEKEEKIEKKENVDSTEIDNHVVDYSDKLSKDYVPTQSTESKIVPISDKDYQENEKSYKDKPEKSEISTKRKISDSIDNESFESHESKSKVRVCKHGKVLNKEKQSIKKRPPETSYESKTKKPNADEKPKNLEKNNETDDPDSNLNWKKLSTSSKMRSYRDGKNNKDENLLYMDRHLKESTHSKKHSSHKSYKEEKRDDSSRHRKHDESKSCKSSRKKESSKHSHHSSRNTDSKEVTHSKSSKSHKHHRHHRHKHSSENRHSHSDTRKTKHKPDIESSSKKQTSKQTTSNYQSYPVIKTLDSKKIYSEGDKILINVNFKADESVSEFKKSSKPSKDTKNGNKISVEISSPQSDDYNNAKSDIASPNSDDYSSKNLKKSLTSTTDNLKNVLSEEFKFLPKLLQNKETNCLSASVLNRMSRSPENYLNDSIPTPTQDESQSPLRNCISKQSKISSIKSNSPLETKDDLYDPELPLESPDRNSISSPSKDRLSIDSSSSSKNSLLKRSITQDKIEQPLSSTVANATATLASLNSINLAKLIQIAQSIKTQNNIPSAANGANLNNKLSQSKHSSQSKHLSQTKHSDTNRDIIEIVDMDIDSPPNEQKSNNYSSSLSNVKEIWNQIMKTASSRLGNNNISSQHTEPKRAKFDLEEQPTSAVDMENKEKYIKKLNRQERVVEEVKLALKPHYQKKKITKDEYKEILRKAVPKICHSKTGEINPLKIQKLVDAYIKRIKYIKKKQTI